MSGAVAFAGRRPADGVAAATGLLLVAVAVFLAVLTVLTVLPAGLSTVAAMAALLGSVGAVEAGRRRRPEARAAGRRLRDVRRQSHALRGTAEALARLDRETADLDRADKRREAQTAKALRDLQAEQLREQSNITRTMQQATIAAQTGIGGLPARKDTLIAAAVGPQIEAYVRDALRRVSIDEAKNLTNMGVKTVRALTDAGIRTAADFDHVTYSVSGSRSTVIAQFRLTGGRYIRVPGIGEARAKALVEWRQGLEMRARSAAPKTLDPALRAQIRDRIAAERAGLEDDVKRAERKAAQDRDALVARIAAERTRLTDAQASSRTVGLRARAALHQQRQQFAGAAATLSRLDTLMKHERAVRAGLGRRRYVVFVVRGR